MNAKDTARDTQRASGADDNPDQFFIDSIWEEWAEGEHGEEETGGGETEENCLPLSGVGEESDARGPGAKGGGIDLAEKTLDGWGGERGEDKQLVIGGVGEDFAMPCDWRSVETDGGEKQTHATRKSCYKCKRRTCRCVKKKNKGTPALSVALKSRGAGKGALLIPPTVPRPLLLAAGTAGEGSRVDAGACAGACADDEHTQFVSWAMAGVLGEVGGAGVGVGGGGSVRDSLLFFGSKLSSGIVPENSTIVSDECAKIGQIADVAESSKAGLQMCDNSHNPYSSKLMGQGLVGAVHRFVYPSYPEDGNTAHEKKGRVQPQSTRQACLLRDKFEPASLPSTLLPVLYSKNMEKAEEETNRFFLLGQAQVVVASAMSRQVCGGAPGKGYSECVGVSNTYTSNHHDVFYIFAAERLNSVITHNCF